MDRLHLLGMEKKVDETFRAYALRWKNIATQVDPPLVETEYAHYFVQTLKGIFFERLCTSVRSPFSEIIQQGETIEKGIREGKLIDLYTGAKSTESPYYKRSNPPKKGKDGEIAMVIPVAPQQSNYQARPVFNQQSNGFQYQTPQFQPRPAVYPTNRQYGPRPPFQRRVFTALAIPYTEVFQRLRATGQVESIPSRPPPEPLPPWFRPEARCEYHSGQPGHDHGRNERTDEGWRAADVS